jgi:hypothetical protein
MDPVSQRFIRLQVCRQVENLLAQRALVSRWIKCMNGGQQLFHVKQKHLMTAAVLLT